MDVHFCLWWCLTRGGVVAEILCLYRGVHIHVREHLQLPAPSSLGWAINMPMPLTLGALSKRFKASLRSPPDNAMMSACAVASMLITGAMLPGGATVCATATDDCWLDAMLAHDLETLRVRPCCTSSAIVASRRFLPLGGRCGPAADDVVPSWPSKLYSKWKCSRPPKAPPPFLPSHCSVLKRVCASIQTYSPLYKPYCVSPEVFFGTNITRWAQGSMQAGCRLRQEQQSQPSNSLNLKRPLLLSREPLYHHHLV